MNIIISILVFVLGLKSLFAAGFDTFVDWFKANPDAI